MFEKNLLVLEDQLNNGVIENIEIMKEFALSDKEEERILALRKVFNNAISYYETIPLWEGEIPQYKEEYLYQNKPQLAFFPNKKGECSGVVIVVPGGGYECKASASEGYPVIEELLKAGFAAALLDYRVKPYTRYESLIDIQRAIRLLRYRADELNIDPLHIAVQGSSAGGNLSSLAAVHFDYGNPKSQDPVEHVSCRPDAAIISYGAFSEAAFLGPITDNGLKSVYGQLDKVKDAVYFSPDKNITIDTPPFFLWQTCDMDDPRYLLNFCKEMADHGVRYEAHIFPFGPHGGSLFDGRNQYNLKDDHVAHWFVLSVEWLRTYGF